MASIALPGMWSSRYVVTTMFPPVLCSPSHPPARATSRETTLALPLPASPKLCAAWTPATTTHQGAARAGTDLVEADAAGQGGPGQPKNGQSAGGEINAEWKTKS